MVVHVIILDFIHDQLLWIQPINYSTIAHVHTLNYIYMGDVVADRAMSYQHHCCMKHKVAISGLKSCTAFFNMQGCCSSFYPALELLLVPRVSEVSTKHERIFRRSYAHVQQRRLSTWQISLCNNQNNNCCLQSFNSKTQQKLLIKTFKPTAHLPKYSETNRLKHVVKTSCVHAPYSPTITFLLVMWEHVQLYHIQLCYSQNITVTIHHLSHQQSDFSSFLSLMHLDY